MQFGLLALALLWVGGDVAAQSPVTPDVSVGIEGHYRVGHWAAVRLSGGEAFGSQDAAIETLDGDGVRVTYDQPDRGSVWGYAVPGSEAAPLIVRNGSTVIVSTRFPELGSPARGPSMVPLKMPWIIAIGDTLDVDTIGSNELLGRDASIAVSAPRDAGAFPDSVLGYDGVDMLIISGSGSELLERFDDKQRSAVRDWVLGGGRLFVTLGESSPQLLQAAPWLQQLLPMDADQFSTTRLDPSAIEMFTSTQIPLETFTGAELPRRVGRILITGRTTRRVSIPIAAEYNVGLGRVMVIAADLDQEMFAAWPQRLDLVTRLTGSVLIPEEDSLITTNRATAFNDLAGQMRATLDQFAVKRSFGFSVASLILLALVAAIGPLDYLLINRVFGRPLLGWMTFPLMAVALSALLVYHARPVVAGASAGSATGKSAAAAVDPAISQLACNRVEIIDIDTFHKVGRGFDWSYLYSHPATRFDLRMKSDRPLEQISTAVEQMLTTPFGYPGKAFGGIQIAGEDIRLPGYHVEINQAAHGQFQSWLRGLPIAPRSSKSMVTRYTFTPNVSAEASLTLRPGSELLEGELTNPLPIDLLNGMLIYRNWAYLLPTRFPAAGTIASVDTLRQKNFRWQLSRQKALESAIESESWDPAMIHSPQRVAEMLMFHDAVGGSHYTSLRDDPLSDLDLSHVLADDRCLLIGRVADPFTLLDASAAAKPHADQTARRVAISAVTLSIVRVVLPVQPRSRR